MIRSRLQRTTWNLAGLAAGALALAFVWAASRVDASVPFAPLSLGDRIIRLTPGDAATLAIDNLGKTASPALAVAITLLFVALATLLPALTASPERARPRVAGIVFAASLFAASLVAPVAPSLTVAAAVAVIAGAVYGASLDWLVGRPRRNDAATAPDPGRRRALLWIGSSALGLAVGGSALGRLLASGEEPSAVLLGGRRRTQLPAAGRDGFPRVPGLSPRITPVRDHYVVDINLVKPNVDADAWRLRIGGLIDEPASYSLTDLQRRFDVVEEVSVLTCISNRVGGPLIANSAWTGVLLRDVLRATGVRRGAVGVVFRCADGYDVSIPVARAMQSTALVAFGQDGRQLTKAHGFPCRIRVPALYGMMNAKWVESIDVVGRDHRGYWAQRGWSETGEVRTQSRIDTPTRAQVAEPTWIAGIAWAGDREISRVEVSLDDGRTWRPAQLRQPGSPVEWTQWAYRWRPTRAGLVTVRCRATDGRGRRQDPARRTPHPDGATGYHAMKINVSS